MIKNRRFPLGVRCPNDVRERVSFFVRIGTHDDVCQPVADVDWVDIFFNGGDALQPVRDFHGLVGDAAFVPFRLRARMFGLTIPNLRILV